jgi:predicted RNA-binding Zn-ribbon protein involved in translation (DUF1610 family)
MINISRSKTNHIFEKQNLSTLLDSRGQYDLYKCKNCGLEGKGRDLLSVWVSGRYKKKSLNCPNAEKAQMIRITQCNAAGRVFANLTPGSLHKVIDPPKGKDNSRGVWVMGVGEPVKVLFEEFEEA